MNIEEALKKSIKGVIGQGGPSTVSDNDGRCLYRGKDGARCGVGWLIDNVHYSKDLENKTVSENAVLEAVERSTGLTFLGREGGTTTNAKCLTAIQASHDQAAGVSIHNGEDFITEFKSNIRRAVDLGSLPSSCLEALQTRTT